MSLSRYTLCLTAMCVAAIGLSAGGQAAAATIIDFGSGSEGFLGSSSYTDPGSGTVVSTTSGSLLALDFGAANANRPRTSPGNVLTRGILSPGDSIGTSSPFPLDVVPGVATRIFTFDFITADTAISMTVTGYDGGGNVLDTITTSYSAPTFAFRDFAGPVISSMMPFARIEIRPSNSIGVAFDNLSLDATGVPEPGTLVLAGLAALGLAGMARRRK